MLPCIGTRRPSSADHRSASASWESSYRPRHITTDGWFLFSRTSLLSSNHIEACPPNPPFPAPNCRICAICVKIRDTVWYSILVIPAYQRREIHSNSFTPYRGNITMAPSDKYKKKELNRREKRNTRSKIIFLSLILPPPEFTRPKVPTCSHDQPIPI